MLNRHFAACTRATRHLVCHVPLGIVHAGRRVPCCRLSRCMRCAVPPAGRLSSVNPLYASAAEYHEYSSAQQCHSPTSATAAVTAASCVRLVCPEPDAVNSIRQCLPVYLPVTVHCLLSLAVAAARSGSCRRSMSAVACTPSRSPSRSASPASMRGSRRAHRSVPHSKYVCTATIPATFPHFSRDVCCTLYHACCVLYNSCSIAFAFVQLVGLNAARGLTFNELPKSALAELSTDTTRGEPSAELQAEAAPSQSVGTTAAQNVRAHDLSWAQKIDTQLAQVCLPPSVH